MILHFHKNHGISMILCQFLVDFERNNVSKIMKITNTLFFGIARRCESRCIPHSVCDHISTCRIELSKRNFDFRFFRCISVTFHENAMVFAWSGTNPYLKSVSSHEIYLNYVEKIENQKFASTMLYGIWQRCHKFNAVCVALQVVPE